MDGPPCADFKEREREREREENTERGREEKLVSGKFRLPMIYGRYIPSHISTFGRMKELYSKGETGRWLGNM